MKWRAVPGLTVPILVAAIPLLGAAIAIFLAYLRNPEKTLILAPVFSSMAILVSALTAFIAAMIASRRSALAQRETAKITEAFRHISGKIWDIDYINSRTSFIEAIRKNKEFSFYANEVKFEHVEDREISRSLNFLANDNEIVAIAIERDVIDEDFYRDWFRSSYISDFDNLRPYIDGLRKRYEIPGLFIKFEKLAERWRAFH